MRGDARDELDRIEKLDAGRGMLEAYAFGRGNLSGGSVGGAIDYSHRLNESLSAVAQAEMAYRYGPSYGLEYRALGGLRWRF